MSIFKNQEVIKIIGILSTGICLGPTPLIAMEINKDSEMNHHSIRIKKNTRYYARSAGQRELAKLPRSKPILEDLQAQIQEKIDQANAIYCVVPVSMYRSKSRYPIKWHSQF